MKKNTYKFLILSFVFLLQGVLSPIWSQGFEDFSNLTAGASYGDGSFVGNDGITWNYVASRDGNGDDNDSGIDLPALMLRRVADNSKVFAQAIPNGIGDFSVKLYKGFTGNGNRQVEVFVNGISVGTSDPFDDFDEHVFTISGINVTGDFDLEIRNITSRQVIVDDITWSAMDNGANTAPSIANVVQIPGENNVTSTDTVAVAADIGDPDGIASAELKWGTTSGDLTNTIAMVFDQASRFNASESIPAFPNGTTIYYEITATDAHPTDPLTATSSEYVYTVADTEPFDLPYFNPLRTAEDVADATSVGFTFNGVTHTASAGGYFRIPSGANIVSPAINTFNLESLLITFDATTYGGNTGQELTVFFSDDNGTTYSALNTYAIASDYKNYIQYLDLSDINVPNGRLKFEMTGGTNSIRFRTLSIAEYEGFVYDNAWMPSNPDGLSNSTDDIYILNGAADLNALTSLNNLFIDNGASLNVHSVLNVAGNITINGELVFVSTATSNGELGPLSANAVVQGNATVQKYLSSNRAYRMLSSAVTTTNSIHDNWQEGAESNTDNPAPGFGTHITGAIIDQENGFDGTFTGNPSLFTADLDAQQFVPIDNTDINVLTAGTGVLMFVRGDRSIDLTDNSSEGETVLRAKGALRVGTYTRTFSSIDAGEFAMFGNPYQSAIDITESFVNSSNVNMDHYYIFDPTIAENGGYVTVDLTDGDGTNTSNSDANKYLQPGQGAQFATVGVGTSSITFNESNKRPGNFTSTNSTGSRTSRENMITVQLYTTDNYTSGKNLHDSFGIVFDPYYNNDFTPADAVKPMNFEENLGIDLNGRLLSLEKREMPSVGDLYQFFTDGYSKSAYTFKIKVDGLEDYLLYLNDAYTGTTTMIENAEFIYDFVVNEEDETSLATDRFSISVEERLGVEDNQLLSGIRLYPNPNAGENIYIYAPKLTGQNVALTINDLSGRIIYEGQQVLQGKEVVVDLVQPLTEGIYLVTLKANEEQQTLRLVIKN